MVLKIGAILKCSVVCTKCKAELFTIGVLQSHGVQIVPLRTAEHCTVVPLVLGTHKFKFNSKYYIENIEIGLLRSQSYQKKFGPLGKANI